jgi:nicotinate-nucleotide adenylyltransferase
VRLGIFGGTFDPIHIGHLIIAEEARVRLGLDEVLFIPAGQPWLKADRPITEARHRLAMAELAVASNPCFRASDVEVARPGPSYTVDTLAELRRKLGPDADIYLILGLDSLRQLSRWHRPERVLEMCTVVGISRPGAEDFDPSTLDAISPGASSKVILLRVPLIDISGTDIRQRVAAGLSIKYRVPEDVEAYIYEQGLYKAASAGRIQS